jgi:DNA-binding transcriptional LysR family regulator
MTLRHYAIFICVCDENSMTGAAEKLHMAQPSVSQAIAELERHYNVKLFERLGRKLFISQAGKELLAYARHIVHLNEKTEDAMKDLSEHGLIRVGASVTVGTYVLNTIIGRFMSLYPRIRILPMVHNTKSIAEMLLSDRLDIGMVEGKVQDVGLVAVPFMEDRLILVCAPSHEFACREMLECDELYNQNFIVREEGSGTRELFESVMTGRNIRWEIGGVYNNAEAIKQAVAAGLGLAVISRMAVHQEVDSGKLAVVDVKGVEFKRQFCLVYHKNKYLSPQIKKLMNLCRENREVETEIC